MVTTTGPAGSKMTSSAAGGLSLRLLSSGTGFVISNPCDKFTIRRFTRNASVLNHYVCPGDSVHPKFIFKPDTDTFGRPSSLNSMVCRPPTSHRQAARRPPLTENLRYPEVVQARKWLKQARSVAVLTGAGVSAESGIPTFRDNNGFWRQFRAEQLATPQAFAQNPELVWEWYDWRRELIAAAQPNAGHFALADMERQVPHFILITQNVDDLHERAGSRNVLHLHGSIFTQTCLRCSRQSTGPRPANCQCGGTLRPGVVWFGEALPPGIWEAAENAVRSSDLLLVVGTSGLVYPAATLASLATRVVEINSTATALSPHMDEILEGPSGEILPRLLA